MQSHLVHLVKMEGMLTPFLTLGWKKTNIFNISGFCRVIALDEWVESSKYKTLGLNYLILKLKQIGVV